MFRKLTLVKGFFLSDFAKKVLITSISKLCAWFFSAQHLCSSCMNCLYLSWSNSTLAGGASTSSIASASGSTLFFLLGVAESSSLLYLLLGVSALLSSFSSSSSSLSLPSWLLFLPGLSKTFLKYANWTSCIASSASSASTSLLSLALAWAVDNLIKVSRALAVTGWVRATPLSKSLALGEIHDVMFTSLNQHTWGLHIHQPTSRWLPL